MKSARKVLTAIALVSVTGIVLSALSFRKSKEDRLFDAIRANDKSEVVSLLNSGANPNFRNKNGVSPMSSAVFGFALEKSFPVADPDQHEQHLQEKKEIFELLLGRGGDVTQVARDVSEIPDFKDFGAVMTSFLAEYQKKSPPEDMMEAAVDLADVFLPPRQVHLLLQVDGGQVSMEVDSGPVPGLSQRHVAKTQTVLYGEKSTQDLRYEIRGDGIYLVATNGVDEEPKLVFPRVLRPGQSIHMNGMTWELHPVDLKGDHVFTEKKTLYPCAVGKFDEGAGTEVYCKDLGWMDQQIGRTHYKVSHDSVHAALTSLEQTSRVPTGQESKKPITVAAATRVDALSLDADLPTAKLFDQFGKSRAEAARRMGMNFIPQRGAKTSCGNLSDCKAFTQVNHLSCFSEQIDITTDSSENKIEYISYQTFNADRCRRTLASPVISEMFQFTHPPDLLIRMESQGNLGIPAVAFWKTDKKFVKIGALCRVIAMDKGKPVVEAFRSCKAVDVIMSGCEKLKCADLESFKKRGSPHEF